ncbi:MAG: hypothetical protein AAF206_22705, partial [Bacteroidota bacterium]
HVRPQFSDQYAIGLTKTFANLSQGSIDVFYRDLHRVIEFKDFAQLLLNDQLETELLEGVGRTYGIEFDYKKQKGRHIIEANYTFSRSERQVVASATQEGVNGGDWYPSIYDQPHAFNLNYAFKPNFRNTFSVNFTYSTGRPITVPIGSFRNSNVLSIPVFSDRNAFRIPDYHRLDLAYTLDVFPKKGKRWKGSWTFSIYNFYGRRNAYSVFFRQVAFQRIRAFRISVLGSVFPSVSYNFKF